MNNKAIRQILTIPMAVDAHNREDPFRSNEQGACSAGALFIFIDNSLELDLNKAKFPNIFSLNATLSSYAPFNTVEMDELHAHRPWTYQLDLSIK